VSAWKTRRLAPRAKKIVARHTDKPAIFAFKSSIDRSADEYIVAYDTAGKYEATWRLELAEGKGAMTELKRVIDMWKPHLARERPGFDLQSIGDRPAVPEDLVQDGMAVAEELEVIVDPEGNTPAWATAAGTDTRAKATKAELETDEAAAADAIHNAQLAAVREKKAVLEAELSRLRDTLRAVLGRSHPDFQKLRADKAGTPDVEDDPNAPQPAPIPPPAPPIS
jgi:hypothetical protein